MRLKRLIELGFEYVTAFEDKMLLRKEEIIHVHFFFGPQKNFIL